MGVVALYRRGSSSFVEWHDRHARIPNGRLCLPACRCDVAHQRGFAWSTERQSGIRSPDPRLATDSRLGVGQRRCSGDADRACVYRRWLYGRLVLSVSRMGAACKREVSANQALVGGAVLCALARQPCNFETATFGQQRDGPGATGAYEPVNLTSEFGGDGFISGKIDPPFRANACYRVRDLRCSFRRRLSAAA